MKNIETIYEAMAEIKNLESQNVRLREALQSYINYYDSTASNLEMKQWLDNEGLPNMRKALSEGMTPEDDIEQARRDI